MKVIVIVGVALLCVGSAAGYEGQRRNSLLLNGEWEFAVGEGTEGAETPEGQAKLRWQRVVLPGPFMEWSQEAATETGFVWAKRVFDVSPDQARGLAVLRWNHIDLGAVAFMNGHQVGANEPTGPYQVIIPTAVLKPGRNEIVLKVAGAAGVRKAKSGFFLIPAGFGSCHRRAMPAILDDVWIDFAGTVYMKWALAIPDLAGSKVTIRVTPAGLERVEGLKLTAQVKGWPDGEMVGRGETYARLIPDPDPLGGDHFLVDVPVPGFKPWTYEECNLYTAEVALTQDGVTLDALSFRFGMREIQAADGNYKLNGNNLWLRGSNLVFEWDWGDIITGKERDYLVTEAREMSMNSFRTHTQPPPRLWCDVCDEYGTMILAEMRCLYNYRDYGFTAEEYDIWHQNVLADAAGWMARLWNHPSVIMWVLSNESRGDNEWEEGVYQDFVNALDPTRPTLRTGTTGTRENLDVHACGNTIGTDEGRLLMQIPGWFAQARGRTVTNTEYMNIFSRPLCQWTGTQDEEADRLAYAQLGMEHTEAMRRARLDGIWPYMYAGWTKTRRGGQEWQAGFAQPVSACWHSALSPVLASLDLFGPNYLTGQEVTTDLYLINDSWHDARINVDLLLTRECPQFIPEAECFDRPVAKWSFDFDLTADTLTTAPVNWTLPDEEGSYWLSARTTGIAGRPVLSQRFVRAVAPPHIAASARRRTFVLLGGDTAATAYFRSKDLRTSTDANGLQPGRHTVIVWKAAQLSEAQRQAAESLCRFAAAGGRVLILSAGKWDWRELCDVTVDASKQFSRVFAHEGVEHPMLAGIGGEWLMRWNGLPGTVAVGQITGPALAGAQKILWAREPGTTVAAEVPMAQGGGTAVFCQLDLPGHLDSSRPSYDPVAERILVNLLAY
jgi:hypothetical protein